jgi:hypothetical protein
MHERIQRGIPTEGALTSVASWFEPMAVCPPSGCLRCGDEHPNESLCGSEVLLQAKALRLPDLRNPYKKLGGGGVIPLTPVQS